MKKYSNDSFVKNELLIICGPTATGKTKLGIEFAKKFNGEIVSADSRQIYKGMDIGTGKDIGMSNVKCQMSNVTIKDKKYDVGCYKVKDIPIWGLDLVNPNEEFSVSHYKEIAGCIINDIQKRGKLPIVVGGTGLYIKALTENISTINVPQNKKLRVELSKKNIFQLQDLLKQIDLARWEKMNESDKQNPRRLIRAVEIAKYKEVKNGKYEDGEGDGERENKNKISQLFIGLTASKEELNKRIDQRVTERIRQGIVDEVKNLLKQGCSWDLPSMSGLGYREFREYFAGKESLNYVIKKWKHNEHRYAKRQLTWFKKQPKIHWYDITAPGYIETIISLTHTWYNERNDDNTN